MLFDDPDSIEKILRGSMFADDNDADDIIFSEEDYGQNCDESENGYIPVINELCSAILATGAESKEVGLLDILREILLDCDAGGYEEVPDLLQENDEFSNWLTSDSRLCEPELDTFSNGITQADIVRQMMEFCEDDPKTKARLQELLDYFVKAYK